MIMDKIEKIKAEIERRIGILQYQPEKLPILKSFKELLSFINSLPQEPVSEDLEEATEKYASRYANSKYGYDKIGDAFKAGANWQKEKIIEKAVEWLKEQNEMIGISFQEDFMERFKNYMKGE